MTELKLELERLISQSIKNRLFPACAIGAITPQAELTVCGGTYTYEDKPIGPDTVFDVASLTKSVPVACLALKLIEDKKLGLHDDIGGYLPEYESNGDKVTVWNLLTHTVYYEYGFRLSSISHLPPAKILQTIFKAPAKVSKSKLTYTNSSSILLGLIIEKLYGLSLAEAGRRVFFEPLGMNKTGFDPYDFTDKQKITPTEIHERRGLVHGDVHDESAFGLRPLSTGTAGLFSTAPDLLRFSRMLLNRGELDGKKYFSPQTIKQMYQNQLSGDEVTGLGWELNQPHYMGKYAKGTFGKTGFTGCVILVSPELSSAAVVLSNHIHPKRPEKFKPINDFRRAAADLVFGSAAAKELQ